MKLSILDHDKKKSARGVKWSEYVATTTKIKQIYFKVVWFQLYCGQWLGQNRILCGGSDSNMVRIIDRTSLAVEYFKYLCIGCHCVIAAMGSLSHLRQKSAGTYCDVINNSCRLFEECLNLCF